MLTDDFTNQTGFFLITTDILGPYGSGFAMGTLGWGPGEPRHCIRGPAIHVS